MPNRFVEAVNLKTATVAFAVLVVGALGVYFFLEAEKAEREADAMQDLLLKSQGIGVEKPVEKPKVAIVLLWDECAEDTIGFDAVDFCNSNTTEKTEDTATCLRNGLLRRRQSDEGYGSYESSDEEIHALACRISEEIPVDSGSWEKTSLSGQLRDAVADVLNQ